MKVLVSPLLYKWEGDQPRCECLVSAVVSHTLSTVGHCDLLGSKNYSFDEVCFQQPQLLRKAILKTGFVQVDV